MLGPSQPYLSVYLAHRLVVEVVDLLPLDALPGILFLLHLEGELDEELLQLLVAVVDAQLLEGGEEEGGGAQWRERGGMEGMVEGVVEVVEGVVEVVDGG